MEPWSPLPQTTLRQDGFRGMKDVIDPGPDDADLPLLIHNMVPLDPAGGGPLLTRPPWVSMGAPSANVCQLICNYARLDGVTDTIAIFDGAIKKFTNPSTWSVYISAASLAGAGITLSASARCFAVVLGGKLVISDGVNTPFMYDGVTATLTKLTACPVLYGQPTIYYAKMFGIKATERSTFVWSEENDPTIGYESGGFNNAWDMFQTGAEPLQALLGTNAALYYWRAHSMGAIRGAVTTDFVNDGTHDGVSATTGTLNSQPLLVDTTIYWADAYARPHCLPIGGDILPLYPQMMRKFDQQRMVDYIAWTASNTYGDGWQIISYDAASPANTAIQIAYDPVLQIVAFGYPVILGFNDGKVTSVQADDITTRTSSAGLIAYMACFHHGTKQMQAYWSFPRKDGAGATYFTSLDRPDIHDQGIAFYNQNIPDGAVGFVLFGQHSGVSSLDDNVVTGGYTQTEIPQFVIGPRQAHTDDIQMAFDRLDVSVAATPKFGSYEAQLGVALQTSNRQVSNELSTPIFSGDASLYPAGGTNQVQTSGNMRETQNSFGLSEQGRWARVLVRFVRSSGAKLASIYPIALYSWTLTAMARTRIPATNISPP